MKVICIILSLVPYPEGMALEATEKPFQSLQQCEAWKYQQEYQYAVRPSIATRYVCVGFWEA